MRQQEITIPKCHQVGSREVTASEAEYRLFLLVLGENRVSFDSGVTESG